MSDELREYMMGFFWGVDDAFHENPVIEQGERYQRGYLAGHAAYAQAERMERERLEACPMCRENPGRILEVVSTVIGEPMQRWVYCPACHGSGRRTA